MAKRTTKKPAAKTTTAAIVSSTFLPVATMAVLMSLTPDQVFDVAVDFVLRDSIEGGYVNDPRDPGGETNFGISKRANPDVNIKGLTREKAIAIYKAKYWDAVDCDKLPPMAAIALFDCAVNQGEGIAPRLLQKTLRVTADGQIGPITLRAVERMDPEELWIEFLGWRLKRYAGTANAHTYMRGWAIRMVRLAIFLTRLERLEETKPATAAA